MNRKGFGKGPRTALADSTIPVAISTRHVHLTAAAIGRLFGAGHALRMRSLLSQPHQFTAQETVTLVTARGELADVHVVGPPRLTNQVEVSRREALLLGLEAPLRVAGRTGKLLPVRVVGPAGGVVLSNAVVLAKRHLHMSAAEARRFGVRDREIVRVAVDVRGRDLIFGDVVVRSSLDYGLELHLDGDEGSAAGLKPNEPSRLMARVEARARVIERVREPTSPDGR